MGEAIGGSMCSYTPIKHAGISNGGITCGRGTCITWNHRLVPRFLGIVYLVKNSQAVKKKVRPCLKMASIKKVVKSKLAAKKWL